MPIYAKSLRIPMCGSVQRTGPRLCPHDMALPAAMMSLKLFMGGQHRTREIQAHNKTWRVDDDYFFFIGVSGEGFRFLFDTAEYFRFQHPEGGQPLADCFASEGIPVSVHAARPVAGVQSVWTDEDELRELVLDTLTKGFPVLILGRTNTDWVLLATGYEDGGDSLMGWTFAPGADTTNKSFSVEECKLVREWSRGVDAVALVKGAPGVPGDRKAIVCRALARGEVFLRRAMNHPHGTLANFYDEWLARLEDAAFWSKPFTDRPYIDPEIWDLAERRCFCADFLEEARVILGGEELAPGIAAFREIHDLMWQVDGLCKGTDARDKLRDAAIRGEIAGILKKCRQLDAQAADAIALARQRCR